MSLKQRFIKSSIWGVMASISDNLSSLITFIVFARLLSPTEFGTVALAMIFITIGRVFVQAGIPDSLIKQKEWNDDLASSAFWTNLGIAVFLCVACLAITPALYSNYDRTFSLVFAALSLTLLVEGTVSVHVAKLRRDFQHKVIAQRGITSNVLGSIIGIALGLSGWGVWALVASRTISSTITSLIIWRSSPFRPRMHFMVAEVRVIAPFSGQVLLSQLLNQLGNQLPAVLLGAVIGPAAVGQYRVGGRILELVTGLIVAPIQSTAVSVFAQLNHDPNGLAKAYSRLTRAAGAVSCPALLGIASIAPDIVLFAFGPQWHEAGYVLVALCLIAGPLTLGYFEAPAMNASGRSDLTFKMSLIGSCGNIVGGLIGLTFGPIGVAAAISIRSYLTLPIALKLMRDVTGLRIGRAIGNIWPSFAAALIMFLAVTALRLGIAGAGLELRLIACIVLGLIIYPCLFFLFFPKQSKAILEEIDGIAGKSAFRLHR